MPLLRININYRKIVIDEQSNEEIAVLLKDGEYRYLRFLGFIGREDAIAINSSVPVKLKVDAYAEEDDVSIQWTSIPPGRHLQGCLTNQGVYCVLNGSVARTI